MASQRAASAARCVITSTLRSPAAASTPSMSSSASPGSSPLVGSSRISTGPGARRARATASRRRSPPDSATPSSPTGVSSPSGSVATQRVEPGGPQRGGDLVLAGVGPGQREVGAHGAREQLGPLVRQRAGGAGVVLGEALHVGAGQRERAVLEGPEAQERGDEARLAGAARAGDGDPAAGGHPQADAVEGAGQARPVAEGGVLEGHLGHAGRRARRERRGRARGRAPPRARRAGRPRRARRARGPRRAARRGRSRRWPARRAGAPPP